MIRAVAPGVCHYCPPPASGPLGPDARTVPRWKLAHHLPCCEACLRARLAELSRPSPPPAPAAAPSCGRCGEPTAWPVAACARCIAAPALA